MMSITPAQCRAARILAEVDRDDLASKAGLSATVMLEFETCSASLPPQDVAALQHALEAFGVRFIPEDSAGGVGVRLKFNRAQVDQLSAWESEGGIAADDEVA